MLMLIIVIIQSCSSIIVQVQTQRAATPVPIADADLRIPMHVLDCVIAGFRELEAQLKPNEYRYHYKATSAFLSDV